MINSQNLLTIKAFAEAAGRSQQAIYKQIGTRLAPFVREIDGKKYIEHRALKEIFGLDVEQPAQPETTNPINPPNNPENELYAILREELAAKNRQIEQLQASLDEQIQINKELAQSINADRKNELAGTMQQLLAEGPSEAPEVPGESLELVLDEDKLKSGTTPSEPAGGVEEAVKGLSLLDKIKLLFFSK